MLKFKKRQLHYVKARFSQLVELAEKGEVVRITRRGQEVVVLISKKSYDQLTKKKEGLRVFSFRSLSRIRSRYHSL